MEVIYKCNCFPNNDPSDYPNWNRCPCCGKKITIIKLRSCSTNFFQIM